MKLLITLDELKNYKSRDLVPLSCDGCNKPFFRAKKDVFRRLKLGGYEQTPRFCSNKCDSESRKNGNYYPCNFCGKAVYRESSQLELHIFCNHSCAASYNNTHKTKGNRRSKLEKWLESELPKHFPHIKFLWNNKNTINSELDIYLPDLKLAFELNGIFHYEPIYGSEKLQSIQNNDQRKFQACLEQGIELVIIDSSQLKYFKPKNAQKYLDIITNVIKLKMRPSC